MSVRIDPSALRLAAVAAIALLCGGTEAIAQNAGLRGGATSPVTDRIIAELRAGANTSGQDGQTDAPALRTSQDGVLGEPAPGPIPQDGLLRGGQEPAIADGDPTADGKLAAPAGATNPLPEPVAPVRAAPARAAPARARPAAEEDFAPVPVPPAPAAPIAEVTPEAVDPPDAPLPPPAPPPVATSDDADPYGAVGYRLGGFLMLPSLNADALYSDNVRQSSTDRQGAIALVLRPSLSLQSQWSRHALGLELKGATTTYARLASDDTKELHLAMRGRFDMTSQASLEAETGYDFNTLSRSDPTVGIGAALLPTTQAENLGLAFNQRFDRVSLRLHGTLVDTRQSDSGSGGLDYRDAGLDGRAGYEFSPSLTVFGTAKSLWRGYSGAGGVDARGNEVRLGLETDPSAKLSGSASLGGASIVAADGSGPGASGAVAAASVTWLPSALTTVTVAAASSLELTSTSGATAVRESKVSLEARHQFRRWLALLAGLGEAGHGYAGIGLSDQLRSGHLGFEYDISRDWAMLGDYQHTDFASSDPARSYLEDQIRLGFRLQR